MSAVQRVKPAVRSVYDRVYPRMVDRLGIVRAQERALHDLCLAAHAPQQDRRQRGLRVAVALALLQQFQRERIGQLVRKAAGGVGQRGAVGDAGAEEIIDCAEICDKVGLRVAELLQKRKHLLVKRRPMAQTVSPSSSK